MKAVGVQEKYDIRKCDVLIIGGGGAGAVACIEASKHKDLKILLASKGGVSQSGLTPTANGGTGTPEVETGFNALVTSGNFLSDQNLCWYLASEIKNALQKLRQLGLEVHQRPGAATVTVPPVMALKKLRRQLLEASNIELLEDVLITSLITDNGKISGATALDLTTGDFFVIQATAVVIATGGLAGELYPHSSNNPFGVSTAASGTGHAMAYLAGAELVDMEMVHFVPVPLGPRWMHLRYSPQMWTAVPFCNRHGDVIEPNVNSYPGKSYSYLFTQGIFRELEKGNGPIYVDHRGAMEPVYRPKSGIRASEVRAKLIRLLAIEPRDQERMEIGIGSHLSCGGIRINEKTETTLPGLYAAGEVFGGLHCFTAKSLARVWVFGFAAGAQAANYAQGRQKNGELSFEQINREKERVFQFLEPKRNPVSIGALSKKLPRIMEDHVFIYRDKTGLTEALKQIRTVKEEVSRVCVSDFKRFNLEWKQAIEFSLTIEVAEIITESALAREESRGCHARRDFPKQDNRKWLKHTVAK
ncbi:MAG: FAD-binding protein, partial [Desulfobacterales bacterium]|nr:FAD-binding protein [Desulfobacterales bacterium]